MSDLPPIPQSDPHAFYREHRAEIDAAAARVLDSGCYILGPEVRAFEQQFSQSQGLGPSVGVGNGTDAITLALNALGIGRGDRVATVSMTAVATVAAVERSGAEPVFIDIDPVTLTMDPGSLEAAFDAISGIRAVLPVHLHGMPADLPALCHATKQCGASVIEDCAQAHGARLLDRPIGSFGDAATFSFYPTKNLGGFGDGGLVACRDPEVAERVRTLRQYGWGDTRESAEVGMNSRLDELHAAMLRYRLPFLAEHNARRRGIAELYREGLAGTGLTLPGSRDGAVSVFHQFAVRSPRRDALAAHLQAAGIGTNIHYPVPVHRQPAYQRRKTAPDGLAVTEKAARELLSLPMFPEMTETQVSRVIEAVRSFRP
jgi:dTDP-4-amino-4,6-dideoxygalactose transaminase